MTDAVFHPSLQVTDPYVYASHWTGHGGNHVTVFTSAPRPFASFEAVNCPPLNATSLVDQRNPVSEAIQVARQVGERLAPLVRGLPAQLAERLGFVGALRPSDWVEILFHLGWHFPDHGIDAGRFRILAASEEAPWDFRCPEPELQLGGVRVSPDVFPGVVVSRLGEGSDFLTASVNALLLILEALDGIERVAEPKPGAEFGRLRDTFLRLAVAHSHFPRELSARVLRLADSFRTPPATEWAGIERGGDGWGIPHFYVLSHLCANRVVCVLRGPGWETFQELANRAGALLPCWPAQPYPAVLNDVGAFARYCDTARFPWAGVACEVWNGGMVTDHRGNVERWLGLVFGLLMAHRLEHLTLVTRPEDVTHSVGGEPVNAMLTLRGMNLFAASALAIELAGLVPIQMIASNNFSPVPLAASGEASPMSAPEPQTLVEDTKRELVHPTPTVARLPAAEAQRLSDLAREEYAKSSRDFTLIAVPCTQLDNGWGFRQHPCEPDSPDAGQLRDGHFYWPLRCISHLGSATIEELGSFLFVAEGRNGDVVRRFGDFAGQAGAALRSAAPPWLVMNRALDAQTLWVAAAFFLSPTARRMTRQHPTGPCFLDNPWAAAITVLGDIPASTPDSSGAPPNENNPAPRVRCEEPDRSVYLDGKRIVGEVELALFRFFRVIAEAYPDPIRFKEIQRRAPGLHGKHRTRDLKDRLPSALANLVQSGKHGYLLKLPAPK